MKNDSEPYRLQDIFFYCTFWRYVKQIHYLYFEENQEVKEYLVEKVNQKLSITKNYVAIGGSKSTFTRTKTFRDMMNRIPITLDHVIYGEAEFSLWRILQLLDMLEIWLIEYNLQNPSIKPIDLRQLKLLLSWKHWQKQYYLDIRNFIHKHHPSKRKESLR